VPVMMRGNIHSPVMGGDGIGVGVGVAAGPISTFPIYTEGTPFIKVFLCTLFSGTGLYR